jgi:hypothetical protein
LELRDQLSIFQIGDSPLSWTGAVRKSPTLWSVGDGEAVAAAVRRAEANPIERPFDKRRLSARPRALRVGPISVTVPPPLTTTEEETAPLGEQQASATKEATAHTEIQWLLAKLGSDMGLDVWVAKNDRGKSINGQTFTGLAKLKNSLQLRFEPAVNKTIELIDVLWLQGNVILAAFEVESTTSVYSGLLRMSDLISMLPNLNIPLFIVAPDDRREKVFSEVNRPTFSKLPTPMNEMCKFISFSALRGKLQQLGELAKYIKPQVLDEISELCEVEVE